MWQFRIIWTLAMIGIFAAVLIGISHSSRTCKARGGNPIVVNAQVVCLKGGVLQ